jgi:hypothetical protein
MGFATYVPVFSASAEDLYSRFYSDIPEETYKNIVMVLDPTGSSSLSAPFGKYAKQILEWYRKYVKAGRGGAEVEGGDDADWANFIRYINVFASLDRYDKGLQGLPQEYKSITVFKTIQSFLLFMYDDFDKATEKVAVEVAKSAIEEVYQDDIWFILIPKTHRASVYYGSEYWCTSYPDDPNYFNQYPTQSIQAYFPLEGLTGHGARREVNDYENTPTNIHVLPDEAIAAMIEHGAPPDIGASPLKAWLRGHTSDFTDGNGHRGKQFKTVLTIIEEDTDTDLSSESALVSLYEFYYSEYNLAALVKASMSAPEGIDFSAFAYVFSSWTDTGKLVEKMFRTASTGPVGSSVDTGWFDLEFKDMVDVFIGSMKNLAYLYVPYPGAGDQFLNNLFGRMFSKHGFEKSFSAAWKNGEGTMTMYRVYRNMLVSSDPSDFYSLPEVARILNPTGDSK